MRDMVIFDFDGVILDSFKDQFDCFKHISSVLGKPFNYSNLEQFREEYEEPVVPNMYHKLGLEWDKNEQVIWKEYKQYKAQSNIELVEGIKPVIIDLYYQGKTMAIASSNTHAAIDKQMEHHGLKFYFDRVVAQEDLPIVDGKTLIKPHPDCLLIALDRLKCEPQEVVYIGDHPVDIIAARRVAESREFPIQTIAVTYGYFSERKLRESKPDYIAHSPRELSNLLYD